MSWNISKNIVNGEPELVIDGFEKGIANSPYEGIADIRNANITTSPNEAAVAFATAMVTLPPTGYTAVSFSSDATTDIFTTAVTTGFYTGMALLIVSVSGGGSGTAGTTYYVGNITATTFKLYTDISCNTLLDVTTNRTGTFTIQTFGTPSDSFSGGSAAFASNNGLAFKYTIVMTSDGLVWYLTYIVQPFSLGGSIPQNTLQFLGNTGHSTAGSINQTGIVIWQGYLFTLMNQKIDYISLSNLNSANPSASWVYAWKDITSSAQGHRAIAATDDAMYFCNNHFVGSLLVVAGSVFDPTTPATYTYNAAALGLPLYELSTCIAQLGQNLLIGGIFSYVYPWDRISTSYNYPLIVAENYTKCIISTNSSAYIFAGQRGNIYLTNGSNITIFKKFPDSISDTIEPYYDWGWAVYLKNQLYFSISGTTNGSTTINNYAGIWAIDLTTSAFRMTNSLSYGSYTGTVPVLVPMGNVRPTGDGLYAGWLTGTGGMDYTSGNPYTNFETRIDTDIIPVGSFLTQNTYSNIEFKLAKPLVSGEAIRLSWRSNLTDAFTIIGTTNTAGMLSDAYSMNFENVQWLQIRIEYNSTVTTPSYTLLRQIVIRK